MSDWETVTLRGRPSAVVECGSCGVVFTVPLVKMKDAWEDGGFFSCPNGHSRGWREGHVEREAIRKERDRLKQRVAHLDDEVKAAADRAEKTAAELKRHKKRASAGTCPCCSRTFLNMNIHMRKMHPEYVKDNVVKLKSA